MFEVKSPRGEQFPRNLEGKIPPIYCDLPMVYLMAYVNGVLLLVELVPVLMGPFAKSKFARLSFLPFVRIFL